nr:hypothetical protein [Tanacetum cinerariifolium]
METYPHFDNGTYDIVERVMRPLALKQTRRPRSDRGKARRFVSSLSSHRQGTLSHQHDDDDDDVKTSRANVEKLTELQIKSLSPELFNLLSSHDFSSSLPTELKELPSKFTELIREIKELKKHVHELEVELPGDLKEILTKLEKFSSTIFSLTTQVNIKTLDAIPSIFFKVNKTLDSSPKNSPQPEGELIQKDKGKKAMSSKDAKEKGTESETDKETNLTDPM